MKHPAQLNFTQHQTWRQRDEVTKHIEQNWHRGHRSIRYIKGSGYKDTVLLRATGVMLPLIGAESSCKGLFGWSFGVQEQTRKQKLQSPWAWGPSALYRSYRFMGPSFPVILILITAGSFPLAHTEARVWIQAKVFPQLLLHYTLS